MTGSCDANKSRQTSGSDREKVARGMARLGRFPFTRAASAPARKTCAKRKAGGAPAIKRPHLSVAVNELVGREPVALRRRETVAGLSGDAAAPAVPQGVKVIHRRAEWSSERPVGWRVLHGPRRSPIPPLIGADRPSLSGTHEESCVCNAYGCPALFCRDRLGSDRRGAAQAVNGALVPRSHYRDCPERR
jgi:hypothetical protein